MSRSKPTVVSGEAEWKIDPISFMLWKKAFSDIENKSVAAPPEGMTEDTWTRFLVTERIAPYYHYACLHNGNLEKDSGLEKSLRRMHLHFLAANEIYLNESFELLRMFNGKGIVPVLLKGIQLQCDVYSSPELRPSSDLDLLVRDEEIFSRAETLLEKLNFVRHDYRSEKYARCVLKEVVFMPPMGRRVMVELHHGLRFGKWDRRRRSDDPLINDDNIHKMNTDRAECLALNDASNYLLLCHHAFKSHINLKRLLWMNDIRLLNKRLSGNREELEKLADESLSRESYEFGNRLIEDMECPPPEPPAYVDGGGSPETVASSKVVEEFRNLDGPTRKAAWLWWWVFPDYRYLKRKYGPDRNALYVCFRHCAGLIRGVARLERAHE